MLPAYCPLPGILPPMASHQPQQARDPSTQRDGSDFGRTAVVIPSLGAPALPNCLSAVNALEPAPGRVLVVLSGGAPKPAEAANTEVLSVSRRLGFATAVNLGIREVAQTANRIALLNDDAVPPRQWLGALGRALDDDPGLAAVQGTVVDGSRELIDGRGITLDRWSLPIQIDRGTPTTPEDDGRRPILAVSATAALYRTEALLAASVGDAAPFDPAFGSYHEDLDLGLRLFRLGWRTAWVPGVPTRHLGSSTGRQLHWRHPWWVLANRWRALAGNLSGQAFISALPTMARGELRAIRTLVRENPRSLPVSAAVMTVWPALVASSWRRRTPGPRLSGIPEIP